MTQIIRVLRGGGAVGINGGTGRGGGGGGGRGGRGHAPRTSVKPREGCENSPLGSSLGRMASASAAQPSSSMAVSPDVW